MPTAAQTDSVSDSQDDHFAGQQPFAVGGRGTEVLGFAVLRDSHAVVHHGLTGDQNIIDIGEAKILIGDMASIHTRRGTTGHRGDDRIRIEEIIGGVAVLNMTGTVIETNPSRAATMMKSAVTETNSRHGHAVADRVFEVQVAFRRAAAAPASAGRSVAVVHPGLADHGQNQRRHVDPH